MLQQHVLSLRKDILHFVFDVHSQAKNSREKYLRAIGLEHIEAASGANQAHQNHQTLPVHVWYRLGCSWNSGRKIILTVHYMYRHIPVQCTARNNNSERPPGPGKPGSAFTQYGPTSGWSAVARRPGRTRCRSVARNSGCQYVTASAVTAEAAASAARTGSDDYCAGSESGSGCSDGDPIAGCGGYRD